MHTKQRIIKETKTLFATGGIEGMSMRDIAGKVGVAQSVLYYYYQDKDSLLKDMFDSVNTTLGRERNKLPLVTTAKEMLNQRITFQLDHAEEIVAVLKYYLMNRGHFKKNKTGYVPLKAYLHIEEALIFGIDKGEFYLSDSTSVAKVITHAINGYVLEYFPKTPKKKEKEKLIEDLGRFLYGGIKHYENA